MTPRTIRLLRALLAGVLAAGLAPAGAATVTRWFEFSSSAGPLQFGPTVGHFSYDDALATAVHPGLMVSGSQLLTDLEVTFGGRTWDETLVEGVEMRFDGTGELTSLLFGSDCHVSGSCSLAAGADRWYLRVGREAILQDFAYNGFGTATPQQSRFVTRLLDAPPAGVPEPASAALVVAALAALAGTRQAKRPWRNQPPGATSRVR